MSVVLRTVLLAWLVGAVALVASGCGATPSIPGPVRARALEFERHEGPTPRWSRWGVVGELRFLEVVIGTDEVERPLPMVLALHGFGDGPRVPGPASTSTPRPPWPTSSSAIKA